MAGTFRKTLAGAAAVGTIAAASKLAKANNIDLKKASQAIVSVYRDNVNSSLESSQKAVDTHSGHTNSATVSHGHRNVSHSFSVPSGTVSPSPADSNYVQRARAHGTGRTTGKADIGQKKLKRELKRFTKRGAESLALPDGREVVYRGEVGSDSFIVDGNYIERVGSKGRARALMRDVIYGANGDDGVEGDKDKPENPFELPLPPGLDGLNPEGLEIPGAAGAGEGVVPGPDGGEIDDKDRPAPGEAAPEGGEAAGPASFTISGKEGGNHNIIRNFLEQTGNYPVGMAGTVKVKDYIPRIGDISITLVDGNVAEKGQDGTINTSDHIVVRAGEDEIGNWEIAREENDEIRNSNIFTLFNGMKYSEAQDVLARMHRAAAGAEGSVEINLGDYERYAMDQGLASLVADVFGEDMAKYVSGEFLNRKKSIADSNVDTDDRVLLRDKEGKTWGFRIEEKHVKGLEEMRDQLFASHVSAEGAAPGEGAGEPAEGAAPKDNPENPGGGSGEPKVKKKYKLTESEVKALISEYGVRDKGIVSGLYVDLDDPSHVEKIDANDYISFVDKEGKEVRRVQVTPDKIGLLKKLNPFDEKVTPVATTEKKPVYVDEMLVLTLPDEAQAVAKSLGVNEYARVSRVEVENREKVEDENGRRMLTVGKETLFRVFDKDGNVVRTARGEDIQIFGRVEEIEGYLGARKAVTTDREDIRYLIGRVGGTSDSRKIAVAYDFDRDGVFDAIGLFDDSGKLASFDELSYDRKKGSHTDTGTHVFNLPQRLNDDDVSKMGDEKKERYAEEISISNYMLTFFAENPDFTLTREEEVREAAKAIGVSEEGAVKIIFRNLSEGEIGADTTMEVYSTHPSNGSVVFKRHAYGDVLMEQREYLNGLLRPRANILTDPEEVAFVKGRLGIDMDDGQVAAVFDVDGDGTGDRILVFSDRDAYEAFDARDYFFVKPKDTLEKNKREARYKDRVINDFTRENVGPQRGAHDDVMHRFDEEGYTLPVEKARKKLFHDISIGNFYQSGRDNEWLEAIDFNFKTFERRLKMGLHFGPAGYKDTEIGVVGGLDFNIDFLNESLTRSFGGINIDLDFGYRVFQNIMRDNVDAFNPSTGQVETFRAMEDTSRENVRGSASIDLNLNRNFWDYHDMGDGVLSVKDFNFFAMGMYERVVENSFLQVGSLFNSDAVDTRWNRSYALGLDADIGVNFSNNNPESELAASFIAHLGYTHLWNNWAYAGEENTTGGRSGDWDRNEFNVIDMGLRSPSSLPVTDWASVGFPSVDWTKYIEHGSGRNNHGGEIMSYMMGARFGDALCRRPVYVMLGFDHENHGDGDTGIDIGASIIVPRWWSKGRAVDPVGSYRKWRLNNRNGGLIEELSVASSDRINTSAPDVDFALYGGFRNMSRLNGMGHSGAHSDGLAPNGGSPREGNFGYVGTMVGRGATHFFIETEFGKYLQESGLYSSLLTGLGFKF